MKHLDATTVGHFLMRCEVR